MPRRLALLLPFALLAACGGEAVDSPVVAGVDPGGVHPEGLGPPGPGPINTCNIVTPAFPPPAAGDLDAGFGCAGTTTFSDATLDISVRAIAVQADDKIVAVGETYNTQSNHHNVWAARFASNGKLDTTFATGGVYTKSFTGGVGGPTSAEAVVVQASGAIVIGGGYRSEDPNVPRKAFLLRLLPTGTLDVTFAPAAATPGILETSGMTFVQSLQLDGSGNLVAAGEKCSGNPAVCTAAVGRLSGATGAPDVAFGSLGFATSNYGGAAPSIANGVVISGTEAVMAGSTTVAGNQDSGVARYGATGLDATFGTGGTKTYNFGDTEAVQGVAKLGTGYVLATTATVSGSDYFMVTRLQSNGTINATFGFYGLFFIGFGASATGAQAGGLLVTPGAQIVAVGTATTSTGHWRMGVARINGAGTLDNTFSDDGSLLISAGADDAVGSAVALQSTGRIITAGWSRNTGGKKRALLVGIRPN